MEDKRYHIELEVITPLSVGAGNDNEWVKGIDYVQKEGKVYVLDMQKAAAQGVDIDTLTTLFLKSDNDGICKLLGRHIADMSKFVFDAPARTENNIKTFLRTQFYNKPLVVGSSIKGSVRSALFNYLRTSEEKNEEVFGTMRDGTDFMRFIRVGDIEMPSTMLVNTKIFNLRKEGVEWFGGWKHRGTDKEGYSHTDSHYNSVGFNTLYECVPPGQKGLGNISLAVNTFNLLEEFGNGNLPYASKKRTLLNEPINRLFQAINDVTKEYLRKEQDFFQRYDAERSDEVLDCIETLLSMIPADGTSCLLKMSAGVGFHSITGDWKYDDYDKTGVWTDPRQAGKKKKYKSRKIAEYNHRLQLMGFVRLRALSQEKACEKERELQQEHHNLQTHMLDAIRLVEVDRQKKIAEEQALQQAKAEENRKHEHYSQLMQQAREAYNSELWDEAIAKAAEAATLYPEKTEAIQLKSDIQKAKDIANFLKKEKEGNKQKFSQPLQEVIKGKTSAGNLVGTTVKWLNVEGHSFGQTELLAFLNEATALAPKEKKQMKSKLASLTKMLDTAVNEELMEKLKTI